MGPHRLRQLYWVYILSSASRTLYVGVTKDLARRVREHRTLRGRSFAARYRVTRLVYAESCESVLDAMRREKQLKGWRRERKIALVSEANPEWRDLL